MMRSSVRPFAWNRTPIGRGPARKALCYTLALWLIALSLGSLDATEGISAAHRDLALPSPEDSAAVQHVVLADVVIHSLQGPDPTSRSTGDEPRIPGRAFGCVGPAPTLVLRAPRVAPSPSHAERLPYHATAPPVT